MAGSRPSYSLATHPDNSALHALVDEAVSLIVAAQQPDGYLHTRFVREQADQRWANMRFHHELYNAGHFFQAAMAHYRATGEKSLLEVSTRFADNICETFGPAAEGKKEEYDGHPEVEMGLVELYRATGNKRYLEQAQFFVDIRRGLGWINHSPQEAIPYREIKKLVAHAVCAVY